jgi:ubiquinone/menaquinone biosynthesis C-methylase UbiE
VGANVEGVEPAGLRTARDLVERFLENRGDRTQQAYTADLEEFARFLGAEVPAAVAQLLATGPAAGHRLMLDYSIELRRRGRAASTIERRLATLRALVRSAQDRGDIEWQLALPAEEEVDAAVERKPARDSVHYLFPRHPGEMDRLDIQHYALRDMLRANHLAPVREPRQILDVGCGTGQWGYEMCDEYPSALVVGFDLVSGKPGQPERYRYVRGNVMHGLPFADDEFDFVHQRLLVTGVPLVAWPGLIAEVVRVTRPGGWVELIEVPIEIERAGPAAQRLVVLTRELTEALGLDTTGVVYGALDQYLRDAGLVNVERREVSLPVGRWGGQIGSYMVTDFRAGVTRVCEVLQARGRLTEEETRILIQDAQQEWEHGRLAYPFAIAFGQKPA